MKKHTANRKLEETLRVPVSATADKRNNISLVGKITGNLSVINGNIHKFYNEFKQHNNQLDSNLDAQNKRIDTIENKLNEQMSVINRILKLLQISLLNEGEPDPTLTDDDKPDVLMGDMDDELPDVIEPAADDADEADPDADDADDAEFDADADPDADELMMNSMVEQLGIDD